MGPLRLILRYTRRPLRLIPLSALVFVLMGTFYWEFWEIPWWKLFGSTPPHGDDSISAMHNADEPIAPLRPLTLNCSDDSVPIVPKQRYCSWNSTLQQCYKMLMPRVHRNTSWVFLGDMGMANIPYLLTLQWPTENLTVTTRRNPCQNLIYYGLPPPDNGWKAPDISKGEGPVGLGKERPYCMDCTRCWNVAMSSGTRTMDEQEHNLTVEYLVVEYVRDVSVPSNVSTTTQETVSYYLDQKLPSVCVASAGIHDAAIQPSISLDLYLQNLDTYLGLLHKSCEKIIWISLHAVVEGQGVVQQNCKLRSWKNAAVELIESREYENVYMIDIWERSFHADFDIPTRLGKRFYASLARFFKSLMAGPDMTIGKL